MPAKESPIQLVERLKNDLIARDDVIAVRDAEIIDLQKKLKDASEQKDRWYRDRESLATNETQLHTMLDCLPGAPPRKSPEDKESYVYSTVLSVVTRLSIWLASAKGGIK